MGAAIRRMTEGDCDPVAGVTARAFYDDPLQVWALPDATTRLDILTRVFALQSRVASLPLGESYTDATRSTAAFWAPPGRWELDAGTVAALAPVAGIVGDRLGHLQAALDAMHEVHPAEPHFYLQGLGTDPPRQGQGLGSAAIAPVLARCDGGGIPAYLESTKARNVGFYERHGFRVVRAFDLPRGGPRLWSMWREPAGG